jgi:hypothetical protein
MPTPEFRVLSELTRVEDFIDDPVFTDVTNHGEIYTRYIVSRFTHEVSDHPGEWTHLANVTPERSPGIGVAKLCVKNRSIDKSEVTLAHLND